MPAMTDPAPEKVAALSRETAVAALTGALEGAYMAGLDGPEGGSHMLRALNAAGCDVARIEEGERPCQHFENFERFKDWMTASERAAVSAVLYFASIESEQEYADRKAAALSDEARP